MNYIVDYEICSIIFVLLLIGISATRRRLGDFQTKLFRIYLAGIFLNLCLDVLTCYTDSYYKVVPIWINVLANSVFLVIQFLIPIIFAQYIFLKVQQIRKRHRKFPWYFCLPAFLGVIMVLSNYWNGCIFFFDDAGYHHGYFHPYLYISAGIYFIWAVIYTIRYRKLIKKKQFMYISAMLLVGIFPTIIQFFLPNYMLSGVGTSLSVFIMYFNGEDLFSYEDNVTGALNRTAFTVHIKESLHKRISEKVFVLGLDNFKLINEIYGMQFGDKVMQLLVSVLQQEYGQTKVFRIGGDKFAVVCDESIENVTVLDRLHRILSRKWIIRGVELELSACICLIHSGRHGEEDVIRAMDYAMERAKSIGKGEFLEVDEKIAEDMARRAAIEQEIMAVIETGRFEVYYQPIFDVHTRRIHSMEALARLKVPGYGYVSPEEFILIAEQNGTILRIGLLVLEEVCRFINEYNLKSKGIEFVEVNLSVVQCMQDAIHDEIKQVLKKYQIPPAMINLEITESAAAYSEEKLVRNMARLSLTDITFSLDDYGSGYSNVNYLVDLPFSIVKIDKYLVWAAVKKVSSRRVLENTIAMFKDINLKVVTEGIENPEMMEMVTAMGADYLQGYYFSKPVPKEKLVKCLEEGYLEEIFKIQEEKNGF